MKRIYFAFLFCLLSVLSFNCQKELSSTNFSVGNTNNNSPAPIIATLQGNILDENGQPAPGVQITVGLKRLLLTQPVTSELEMQLLIKMHL